MDKRGDAVCKIFCYQFREVLIKKTSPTYTINLGDLKNLLGVIFHLPRDKTPEVVRMLVDYKIILPKNKNYWYEFEVNCK